MSDGKVKDEKLEETIKAIQEAKKKYDELCQDEHACYIAELREKYVWETASVRQLGKDEGRKEGEKKKAEEVAKIMKNKKYSIDEISQITELSKEEIEKL